MTSGVSTSGVVPFADLTISYEGRFGPVQETLAEAPEAELHATRSLPPDFEGVSIMFVSSMISFPLVS